MSDILIKDVGLPNPNEVLWLAISHDGTVKEGYGQIMDSKAIEVSTHGRLIDADELEASDAIIVGKEAWNMVHNAPTILEASK